MTDKYNKIELVPETQGLTGMIHPEHYAVDFEKGCSFWESFDENGNFEGIVVDSVNSPLLTIEQADILLKYLQLVKKKRLKK